MKEVITMTYARFTGATGYCGTDYEELICFDREVDDNFLDKYSAILVEENAESYEYLMRDDIDEDCDEEEATFNYYEDCYGEWERITKEEYDELNGNCIVKII